jgi:hypothetical protein
MSLVAVGMSTRIRRILSARTPGSPSSAFVGDVTRPIINRLESSVSAAKSTGVRNVRQRARGCTSERNFRRTCQLCPQLRVYCCIAVSEVMGPVSRVPPVQTAMRNCTRDEGRPFEVGNQVLISSHRKLLSSKAMVVNVAEKAGTRFRQA